MLGNHDIQIDGQKVLVELRCCKRGNRGYFSLSTVSLISPSIDLELHLLLPFEILIMKSFRKLQTLLN